MNTWPEETRLAALRMFLDGKQTPEIASSIGKRTRSVAMWFYRLGIRRGPRPITYSEREIRLIRKRARLRYGAEEIGAIIGRSDDAIKGICRRLRIRLRPPRSDAWTPYELDALRRNDKKLKDFGASIGRSRDAVAQKRRELGIRRWSANMEWPVDKVERLRAMIQEGEKSAEQMATELGLGFSRNAVIGKAARLGLSIHKGTRGRVQLSPEARARRNEQKRATRTVQRQQGYASPRLPRPARAPTPVVEYVPPTEPKLPSAAVAPRGAGEAMLALKFDSCRWPYGHPTDDDFCFCMEVVDDPHSNALTRYCNWHLMKSIASTARAG